jgi:hypothetical protein
MTSSQHDLSHLIALVEAAKAHAARLGPEVGPVSRLLDEAIVRVRELQANGGKADEGLRPQDLTTENDE